jgi:hypothetical protein
MVILKDLFKLLATGEFSNINLSRDNTGSIKESEYEKVIGHINLGILEIYKRFKFLKEELTLHVNPSVEKYYLRSERITSLHNIDTTSYIERPVGADGDDQINIIEVTGVYASDGEEYVINNRLIIPAILQLSPDTIKITGLTTAEIMSVVYQAYPSKITTEGDYFDPEDYAVHIPEVIIEPLLYYVASRVYKPMGSNDSTANADKSVGYEQKYELACQKLDLYGLDPQYNDEDPDTFENEGWA